MTVKKRIIADLIGTMQEEFSIGGTKLLPGPGTGTALTLPSYTGQLVVADENGNLLNANGGGGGDGTNDYLQLINVPASFPPDPHRHDASEIDNLPAGGGTNDYQALINVPASFPPDPHRHDASEIDNLPAGAAVNADWNAASGQAMILNKPTLGTMASQAANSVSITGGTIKAGATRLDSIKAGAGTSATAPYAVTVAPGYRIGWTNSADTGAGPYMESDGNNILFVNKTAAEIMRVTTNRNLVVGSTTDDGVNKLQVTGNAKISGGLILKPPATNTPQTIGELTIETVSNTSIRLRLCGTDGIIRTVTLNLS